MNNSSKKSHNLSKILNALMKEKNIDELFLSQETKIPVSTIIRIKTNNDANPTISTLRPIAQYFKISIDQLLGDQYLIENQKKTIPVISMNQLNNFLLKKDKTIINKTILTEKDVSDDSFAIKILSDDFGFIIPENSIVIIDPKTKPIHNDIVLIFDKEIEKYSFKKMIIDLESIYLKSILVNVKDVFKIKKHHCISGVLIESRLEIKKEQEDEEKNIIFNGFLKPQEI